MKIQIRINFNLLQRISICNELFFLVSFFFFQKIPKIQNLVLVKQIIENTPGLNFVYDGRIENLQEFIRKELQEKKVEFVTSIFHWKLLCQKSLLCKNIQQAWNFFKHNYLQTYDNMTGEKKKKHRYKNSFLLHSSFFFFFNFIQIILENQMNVVSHPKIPWEAYKEF